jgi:hypothetical protein
VLLLEKKMRTLALFFNGECQAGVGLTTPTVSLSREAVDPSRLAAVASMSLGLEYVMIDLRFGKAGGALLRAVASSPWMLKITPSRATHADSDKQSSHHLRGHGGRINEGLASRHTERFRQCTKVKIQGRDNELSGGRRPLG